MMMWSWTERRTFRHECEEENRSASECVTAAYTACPVCAYSAVYRCRSIHSTLTPAPLQSLLPSLPSHPDLPTASHQYHFRNSHSASVSFFFFNDTPTTEIYTLSLHDALPI